ncbi:MAG: AI-2E family transporter [Candidatus Rickettsia vulgarisii]
MLVLVPSALTPFFIAAIISYMLQPLVVYLSRRHKFPKLITVSIISLLFFSIFIIVVVLLLPIIYQQITLLISKIPIYKNYLQTQLVPLITHKIHLIDPMITDKLKDSINNFANGIFLLITSLANNIWRYTLTTINLFFLFLLIPIIMFYFLRDWLEMTNIIDNLLPLKNKDKIKKILSSINYTLAAYIRGQLNVCLLLSVYYSISLAVIGVDFSILLGVLSGFSIIIPFVGIIISFSLTIIISYFALGISTKLFYIIIIYCIGSIIDSYLLAPKMIGDKIGLHPLWIIFAVLALGNLLGFIGILFAIPIAGIIKVLFVNAIECYKSSKFYNS